MERHLIILLMLMLTLALAGCKTFEGLGQDMQKAGEWVEEKAK